MSAEDIKQLKIKTGSVKRTHKELVSYEQEVEKESARLQKLKDTNADSHDVRQAVSREGNGKRRETSRLVNPSPPTFFSERLMKKMLKSGT